MFTVKHFSVAREVISASGNRVTSENMHVKPFRKFSFHISYLAMNSCRKLLSNTSLHMTHLLSLCLLSHFVFASSHVDACCSQQRFTLPTSPLARIPLELLDMAANTYEAAMNLVR